MLSLSGKKYRLRPSHAVIAQIEVEADRSILQLAVMAAARQLKLGDLQTIVTLLIRAGAESDSTDRHVDADRIGELIFEEGALSVQEALSDCLREAATGGRTASGEAKAAPAAKKETAGAA